MRLRSVCLTLAAVCSLTAQEGVPTLTLAHGMRFVAMPSESGPIRLVQATEMPRAVWRKVMGTEPWKVHEPKFRPGDDIPAAFVSWHEIQTFVEKLNESDWDHTYRLPTEAEWEEACRAGEDKDPGPLSQVAWFSDNAFKGGQKYTHAVGLKTPNAWGLYDCLGNVWEWVTDGTAEGERVIKGGSWRTVAEVTTSRERNRMAPDQRAGDLGFRLMAKAEENGQWSPWTEADSGQPSPQWRIRWSQSDGKRSSWILNVRNTSAAAREVVIRWGMQDSVQSVNLRMDPYRIHEVLGEFLRSRKGERPAVTITVVDEAK